MVSSTSSRLGSSWNLSWRGVTGPIVSRDVEMGEDCAGVWYLVDEDGAAGGVVEVEATDVVGALVPGHDKAVVEGSAHRGDVMWLASQRYVVDDHDDEAGVPSDSGRARKHGCSRSERSRVPRRGT